MKIYVFTCHTAVDGEYLGTTNEVYHSKWMAVDAFLKWRSDEIDYVQRANWKIGTDTDEHFEAYDEGDYCCNHTEGFINEYEI